MRPIIGICGSYSYDKEKHTLGHDYIKSVEKAGGCPVILPVTDNKESLSAIISKLDGVLFTGGSDIDPQFYGEIPHRHLGEINPRRDKHEIELAKYVLYHTELPILGICRGIQLLNVVSGGSLYQNLATEKSKSIKHNLDNYPKHHPNQVIELKPGSKLFEIFAQEQIVVNSYHHQAVKQVGNNFEVTATARDGVVEAIEMKGNRFVVGVQWHPEAMVDHSKESRLLFEAFVKECGMKRGIV